MEILDILIVAGIAIFFGLRLRSVLGRKEGFQEDRSEYEYLSQETQEEKPSTAKSGRKKGFSSKEDAENLPKTKTEKAFPELCIIRQKMAGFTEKSFLEGAEGAYEKVLEAFSSGDQKTLKELLSPKIFRLFSQKIRDRKKDKRTLENTLVQLHPPKIISANVVRGHSHVGVLFESLQIFVLRDEKKNILEGDDKKPRKVRDRWLFSRKLHNPDRNWLLEEILQS